MAPSPALRADMQQSKTLSWLLRHGAHKEGLAIGADGFISVAAILRHPKYAGQFTLGSIKRIVENDAKQRYTLRQGSATEEFFIKANQGHSMPVVEAESCLTPIVNAVDVPLAVHGTYYRHWPQIKCQGLRCMGRNHIHFAVTDQVSEGISGFRSNCQLLIYLDVNKAMAQAGMRFYRSANNVILSAGIEGKILPEYFRKVVDRQTMLPVDF